MRSLRWKIAGHALDLQRTVLLRGLLSATLVRLAPGFEADERELDLYLNARACRHYGKPEGESTTFSASICPITPQSTSVVWGADLGADYDVLAIGDNQ